MPRPASPRPTAVKPPSGGVVSVRVRTEQDFEKPEYDFLVAEASQRGMTLVELLAQITASGVHRFIAENARGTGSAPVEAPAPAVRIEAAKTVAKALASEPPMPPAAPKARPKAPENPSADSRFVLREDEDTESMLVRVSKETGVPLPIVTRGYEKHLRDQVAAAPKPATVAGTTSKPKTQRGSKKPAAKTKATAKKTPTKVVSKDRKKKAGKAK